MSTTVANEACPGPEFGPGPPGNFDPPRTGRSCSFSQKAALEAQALECGQNPDAQLTTCRSLLGPGLFYLPHHTDLRGTRPSEMHTTCLRVWNRCNTDCRGGDQRSYGKSGCWLLLGADRPR